MKLNTLKSKDKVNYLYQLLNDNPLNVESI